jgi:hypothetical protein
MTKIDEWKDLNEIDMIGIEWTIPELADRVVKMNRGAHRMLSAMVPALRAKRRDHGFSDSELADAIEKILNDGLYY